MNTEKTGRDASRTVIIVALLGVAVVVIAVAVGVAEAAWMFGGLVVGALAGIFLTKHKDSQPKLKLSPRQRRYADKRYVLVIANQTLSGEALRREIIHRSSSLDTEVEIVCPALNDASKDSTEDEEDAQSRAKTSLESMMNNLRSSGLIARGRTGSADPIRALDEAMYRFPADEVIISTHPYGDSGWLERDVVEYARNHFPVPVTHVIVDLEHEKNQE